MNIIYKTKDNKEFDNELDATRHERFLRQKVEINTTQMIVFDLIKRASMNALDGEHIVDYLIKNKDKWVGVMPIVEHYALRDIDDDIFHIDEIRIRCHNEESAKKFIPLLKRNLHPDEISIEDKSREFNSTIRLWWD